MGTMNWLVPWVPSTVNARVDRSKADFTKVAQSHRPMCTSGLSQKGSVSKIHFDVLNGSVYNFWEPKFIVLLTRSNVLIGAIPVVIDGLNNGEKKSEDINVFQALPSGITLEIVPDVNILDPEVFKGFEQGLTNP